jgi:phosphoglucosamine mutase
LLPQVLINVPMKRGFDLRRDPTVAPAVAHAEEQLAGRGRVLLRPSGTEPVVRVMVEGEEEVQVRGLAEELAGVIGKVAAP